LGEKLCAWYAYHHRDLPWRQTQDAYAIWVSEVMLQQTQVATVRPYYARFLARFPDVATLAAAPLDDVLKCWEGLGYYARCRHLHEAAQMIVAEHDGRFPSTFEAVLALPGIGRSTAGAILTFAFGQTWPILDGNVKRVLCRLDDVAADPSRPTVERSLWLRSQALLDSAPDPAVFNQALMELGATCCLPTEKPHCLLCPWRQDCQAFAAGTQAQRPVKGIKKVVPHYVVAVGVIWQGPNRQQVLIQQRPAEGLLGGLWEFPGGKQAPGEPLSGTVRREIQEELGIDVAVQEKIITVKHAYTHFKITLHAYHCLWLGGQPQPRAAQQVCWVSPQALETFAFPTANKKILTRLLENPSAYNAK
jgi:A/G-specific adenine glycosylase